MNYGMAYTSILETNELCDQCRALAFAITELTHPIARDVLLWILVERLDLLGLRFEDEELVLQLA